MIDQRLITFLAVCKTNNFTKASELLNLTQPAVTKHIKSLEEFYGTHLFIRSGRSIHLSEEGKILLKYAKDMESRASLLERKIKNSVEVEKRYLIGATLTIGEYVLPDILGSYKVANPLIDIIMQVYNTEHVIKKLTNGDIDLGILEGPFDKNKFCSILLCDDELVFAVSPQNKLAKRSEVELHEILNSKLILREEGSGTRKVLEEKLTDLGCLKHLKPYMEIGSLGAIKTLVELNLGCTIISKTAIQKEVAAKNLVIVPIKDFKILREFNFIFLKESPNEFVESFIAFSTRLLNQK